MSSAATLDMKALDAAQQKISARHQAGVLAMRQVCGPSAPEDLADAAVLVQKLMRERDEARKQRDDAQKAAEAARGEVAAIEASDKAAMANLVAGEPEAANGASVTNVLACIDRLRKRADDAEAREKALLEAVRETFTLQGLVELPGMIGHFAGHNPLLNAVESAAVVVHGDRVAQEAWMRRRGWILSNGGWQDPTDAAKWPFDSAVKEQYKRDLWRFRGLGSREWKGLPEVKGGGACTD